MVRRLPLPPFLWLACIAGFVVMAAFAAGYDYFPADIWLTHRLQGLRADAFLRALDWAEDLADMPLLLTVYLLAALAIWAKGGRWALLALGLTALGRLPNVLVKELVERPRPSGEIVAVHEAASGLSFPSGHAEGAILLYGFLAYQAAALTASRPLRCLAQAACLAVIGLVAIQRVQAGVHWASDSIGGLLLGGLILSLLIWLQRRISSLSGHAAR